METKIQLNHPDGKKAIKMSIDKYEVIKTSLLNSLKSEKSLTHSEILQFIKSEFDKNNTTFEGSIQWYMQSVKMDLEAKKIISKKGKSPAKYTLRV